MISVDLVVVVVPAAVHLVLFQTTCTEDQVHLEKSSLLNITIARQPQTKKTLADTQIDHDLENWPATNTEHVAHPRLDVFAFHVGKCMGVKRCSSFGHHASE